MEGLMQCPFGLIVTEADRLEPGYRSAVQENAVVVSLQMFSLILEKCVSLLREQLDRPTEALSSDLIVSEDMQVLLPAVKVSGICLVMNVAVFCPWLGICCTLVAGSADFRPLR
jgi:protein SMG6